MAAPRQEPLLEDIYGFLQGHQEKKFRSTATGSSEYTHLELFPKAPRDALTLSEDSRSHPSETHVSSVASGETRRSSIFDTPGYSSSTSSVLPGRQQRLPCEFFWYGDCEETFGLHDINGWVHHVATQHLDMILPTKCKCWFCDEWVFLAEPEDFQQRDLCYTARIHHIAEHYRQGAMTTDVRPDFDFLDHLWENDLISRRDFQYMKDYHEAPQPRNGINPIPTAPSARSTVAVAVAVEVRPRHRGRRESRRSYYS
ncbi:hypothetical protein HDV57DRAFT_346895 [Trichoderma longibrachiatum]|uniref:Uncharacterized protein n=1 Tax=Trichoderma longibrachiatum ATCC 18648 TaxID=983965 RepID=A0A2T4BXX2_TRILO|nr:hypothetical protein M440DRAFT_1040782 [Trichoderma longibrachiatum ATCC 18648]